MPNRILKESITTSDTLNQLSAEEERFFYRLLVCADDFGRFEARPSVIKGRTFPLKDEVTAALVAAWLSKLQAVGLVELYVGAGKFCLQFATWNEHNRVRAQTSRFPVPESVCEQMTAEEILAWSPAGNRQRLTARDSTCEQPPAHDISRQQVTAHAALSESESEVGCEVAHERGRVRASEPAPQPPTAQPSTPPEGPPADQKPPLKVIPGGEAKPAADPPATSQSDRGPNPYAGNFQRLKADAKRVFDEYRDRIAPRDKYLTEYENKLHTWLKGSRSVSAEDTFTVQDLLEAVWGYASSEFHQGKNRINKNLLDFERVFGTGLHIKEGIDLWAKRQADKAARDKPASNEMKSPLPEPKSAAEVAASKAHIPRPLFDAGAAS